MKSPALVVVLSLLAAPLLCAADPDLSFPAPQVAPTSLSLREQIESGALAQRSPVLRGPQLGLDFASPGRGGGSERATLPPSAAHSPRALSQMPIVVPRTDVDYKLRIVTPRTDVDYKLIVVPAGPAKTEAAK
jgi:hypothetical protein